VQALRQLRSKDVDEQRESYEARTSVTLKLAGILDPCRMRTAKETNYWGSIALTMIPKFLMLLNETQIHILIAQTTCTQFTCAQSIAKGGSLEPRCAWKRHGNRQRQRFMKGRL